jgi:DNA mismatch endonuclease (patch repair protein)
MEDRIIVPAFSEKNGFVTTEQRSKHMSKIRSKNTKPELEFRKALHAKGVRYRTFSKSLPGKPDLSSVKRKFAVFIDGEFWHGYDWVVQREKIKSNRDFWIAKIERNMQRGKEVDAELEKMGIKVFRFWSKEVKKDLEGCVQKVLDHLSS